MGQSSNLKRFNNILQEGEDIPDKLKCKTCGSELINLNRRDMLAFDTFECPNCKNWIYIPIGEEE
jgi:hypothetical protein